MLKEQGDDADAQAEAHVLSSQQHTPYIFHKNLTW